MENFYTETAKRLDALVEKDPKSQDAEKKRLDDMEYYAYILMNQLEFLLHTIEEKRKYINK